MNHRPLIPYLYDTATGAVRVPAAIEHRLGKLLHKLVKIRSSQDLALALIAALQVSVLENLTRTVQQAQVHADTLDPNDPTK